eukprot:6211972-Amphidinium_carterae.1
MEHRMGSHIPTSGSKRSAVDKPAQPAFPSPPKTYKMPAADTAAQLRLLHVMLEIKPQAPMAGSKRSTDSSGVFS